MATKTFLSPSTFLQKGLGSGEVTNKEQTSSTCCSIYRFIRWNFTNISPFEQLVVVLLPTNIIPHLDFTSVYSISLYTWFQLDYLNILHYESWCGVVDWSGSPPANVQMQIGMVSLLWRKWTRKGRFVAGTKQDKHIRQSARKANNNLHLPKPFMTPRTFLFLLIIRSLTAHARWYRGVIRVRPMMTIDEERQSACVAPFFARRSSYLYWMAATFAWHTKLQLQAFSQSETSQSRQNSSRGRSFSWR